jgi:branched-chain amino acid transport system permease protein
MSQITEIEAPVSGGLRKFWSGAKEQIRFIPLSGWLFAALISVLLEQFIGNPFAHALGISKAPVLFGFVLALSQPALIPSAIAYVLVIYILPVLILAKLTEKIANRLSRWLIGYPIVISAILHIALLYATLQIWSSISDYRVLVLKLTLIAIIVTLSLNVVNGYMGEFSCSHPGFLAVGAYIASILTVLFFVDDAVFGKALLPKALAPYGFPIVLIISGLVTAVSALLVAIPSFRTRGDYLAIISLAFMFIIKSTIENLEFIGGARGFSGQPDLASLPVVFIWTILSIWIINNFVRSTVGKALNAVRDGELAAETMTVDTRKTKTIAFLFAAFWAGVAGGLFAHVLRYVNPGTFGIQKLAEVLAMVYFGGLNSVVGSVVGAVSLTVLGEALRPLEIYKWIIIPVMLILVMVYRPSGLISFRELDIKKLLKPKHKSEEEEKEEEDYGLA